MADRFEDALANLDSGCASQDDLLVMREALVDHIARGESRIDAAVPRTAFRQLCSGWLIGQERYKDWVGYELIHKLLSHPGEEFHVQELTSKTNPENARKAIQKSISRAVDALITTQPNVGLHLESHINTGEFCSYSGTWDWLL